MNPVEDLLAHSPLGASGADRWMNCPGSVALLKQLTLPPTDEPEYTSNGLCAHGGLETCLVDGADAWEMMGKKFYKDVEFNTDMANGVQVFLDDVRPYMAQEGAQVYIEYKMHHPDFHAQFYGTIDWGWVAGPKLRVRDYKNGAGVGVEVKDNPQIMYYAYGLLRDFPQVEECDLGIIQPNYPHPDGPVRTWKVSATYVREWAETKLKPAMDRTEMDNDLAPGKWCRFCPAKLVCPALVSLFGAAALANPAHVPNLSSQVLGISWGYIAAVKKYIAVLEAEVMRRNLLGEDVPGTKLVNKRAWRVYKDGADVVFRARFGDDLVMTAPTLKGPADMERVSPEAKKLVREWAYTPQTGYTIAAEEDNRVAVRPQKTTEVFASALAQLESRDEKE